MSERENKNFANSRSWTHSRTCSSAPIWGGRERQRWMILAGEIKSFPETCADHGLSRSTSAPASFLNAFFSIFFSEYARARSTGRGGRPAVHARMNNEIADHNYEINHTIILELR